MYNVIFFWLTIFGIVYVFTKKDKEEDRQEKEKRKKQDKTSREVEEEKMLTIPHRRSEISRFLNDGFNEEEKTLELKRFQNKCFNCETDENLELDHHLPLSKGYPLRSNEIGSNTVILCRRCNREKGDKLPTDFYKGDKLKRLEEMGIKSHLYYSPRKLIELEELLLGEKIKKIEKGTKEGKEITFTYYDMSKILFLEEEVKEIPIKVYSRKRILKCGTRWEWILEGQDEKLYNIRWMYRIKLEDRVELLDKQETPF